MEMNRAIKVVYEDDKVSKVIRGKVVKEDEFTITLLPVFGTNEIIIGKRAIIKIEVSQ